jgi:hypothetical protein
MIKQFRRLVPETHLRLNPWPAKNDIALGGKRVPIDIAAICDILLLLANRHLRTKEHKHLGGI